ncbi:hypothetical protein KDK77_06805 [bacterium]|nr:hypothetical protein [bacterium]MCP5463068.1 hypothetical protein [bacterium]
MKKIRGIICLISLAATLCAVAGCTYHEHYYGVGSLADKDVVVKESNQAE